MRAPALGTLLALLTLATSCAPAAANQQFDPVIAAERAALDRWGKGDPQGYLETYAPEITYFDPSQPKRIDGIAAMRDYLLPITGMVKIDRYDMLNPKVQRHGDVAVLTFNLRTDGRSPDSQTRVTRWHSTAVYVRSGGRWRMVHNHWSFSAPDTSGSRER
jgi:ketosteroid isomerase-like protein